MRETVQQQINQTIYDIYLNIDQVRFPIDPAKVIAMFPNCRIMTYDTLAEVSGKAHEEIIKACESYDGCTKYSPATDRYLILVNDSNRNSRCMERVRWTMTHELGHIVCGHFGELSGVQSGEIQSSEIDNTEMEEEADFFAASLLAPLQALSIVGVKDIADICKGFGLSQLAAERRWSEFKDFLYNSTTAVYSQKPSLWSLFRKRGILCPIPYHFYRSPKLPSIAPIDVSYPDADL